MKLRWFIVSFLAALVASASPACSKAGHDEPAELFHRVSEALEDGRPELLWELLPERYVSGVDGLVHTFAQRMDPEVWKRGVDVIGKVGRVLSEKRDLLLGHPMLAMVTMGSDPKQTRARLGAVGDVLEALSEGDAATLEGLARIDVRKFLSSTLTPLFEQIDPELLRQQALPALASGGLDWMTREFTTTTERHGDDRATVTIQCADGRTERFDMVEVDGKWFLAASFEAWEESLATARQAIEAFVITPEQKQQVLALLKGIDSVLEGLLDADTQEEFTAAGSQAMQLLGGLGALSGLGGG